MTSHDFQCEPCGYRYELEWPISKALPPLSCPHCEGPMAKVWGPAQFICRGDPDEIPYECQTADVGGGIAADGSLLPTTHAQVVGPSKEQARRKERSYQTFIEERRRLFREEGQVGARMTYQVPAELHWGKIKQTGDPDYWKDDSNLKRHKSCKVS